ncbi:MAG TPA: hypothetical protein PLZ13_17540 [Ottowia sp.]|nr:hypothetical protein [Ottowia sp.]
MPQLVQSGAQIRVLEQGDGVGVRHVSAALGLLQCARHQGAASDRLGHEARGVLRVELGGRYAQPLADGVEERRRQRGIGAIDCRREAPGGVQLLRDVGFDLAHLLGAGQIGVLLDGQTVQFVLVDALGLLTGELARLGAGHGVR